MIKEGQVVEIPRNSKLYKNETFKTKKEELLYKIKQRKYTLYDGFITGEHKNINSFKIGQRKGINSGGKKLPLYVIGIDKNENRLFVGQGNDHPGLSADVLSFSENKLTFSETNFSSYPINVEVYSPLIKTKTLAKLYKFNQLFYLEFSTKTKLEIINYPIDLLINNEIKAKIENN